jgi:hypothetical protein
MAQTAQSQIQFLVYRVARKKDMRDPLIVDRLALSSR